MPESEPGWAVADGRVVKELDAAAMVLDVSRWSCDSSPTRIYHLGLARQNGATETELIETITHLAFYAGWPKAMSAMAVAKQLFTKNEEQSRSGPDS